MCDVEHHDVNGVDRRYSDGLHTLPLSSVLCAGKEIKCDTCVGKLGYTVRAYVNPSLPSAGPIFIDYWSQPCDVVVEHFFISDRAIDSAVCAFSMTERACICFLDLLALRGHGGYGINLVRQERTQPKG